MSDLKNARKALFDHVDSLAANGAAKPRRGRWRRGNGPTILLLGGSVAGLLVLLYLLLLMAHSSADNNTTISTTVNHAHDVQVQNVTQ